MFVISCPHQFPKSHDNYLLWLFFQNLSLPKHLPVHNLERKRGENIIIDLKAFEFCISVDPRVQLSDAGLGVRSVGNRRQSCKYDWSSEHKSHLLNSEHQTALTDTRSFPEGILCISSFSTPFPFPAPLLPMAPGSRVPLSTFWLTCSHVVDYAKPIYQLGWCQLLDHSNRRKHRRNFHESHLVGAVSL